MVTLEQLVRNQPGLAAVTNIVVGMLVVATVIYGALAWRPPTPNLPKIGSRISFLWVLTTVFVLSILYSYKVLILYIWFIAFLALKEYLSMTPTRRADRRVLFCAYLSLPIQFGLILLGWREAFIVFVPIYVFLVLPMLMVLVGDTRGFLRAWSTLGWGVITTVYSLGYLAYLLVLPAAQNPTVGGNGLFLFLVGLAQLNHSTQFIFGRFFPSERWKIKVSKTRSWPSLLGSILVTIPVAWWVGPALTPFTPLEAVLMGCLISIGAFIGYIIVSAIKTDLQLRDRGTMTPGQGGVLNRIDTFIYTAPLFFYLVWQFHYN